MGTSDWPPAEAQDRVAAWVPTPPTPHWGCPRVSLVLFCARVCPRECALLCRVWLPPTHTVRTPCQAHGLRPEESAH